ncbi:hypothetical protein GW17_00022935 [Ensete ventricosum]|nr:hypothetical protein GW17_00022935 [Ensete ventricosum]
MARFSVEVCLISARGLHRSSSFLKPQWFAVGWIDPNSKYCTKVDSSGSTNPTWKTKFSATIDEATSSLQALALTVEVYKREPIFLREKLQGTAVIPLKEFLVKFLNAAEPSRGGMKESGSFQLRKRNSTMPHGFIDVSIHISDNTHQSTSRQGTDEGFRYSGNEEGITLAIEDGPVIAFPLSSQPPSLGDVHGDYARHSHPYSLPGPPAHPAANYHNTLQPGTGYHRTPTPPPPPPPPPSNTGFLPSLFPGTAPLPETYVNLPPSSGPARRGGTPGFGMGLGAGALAAGAVIFGDDFMAGSSFPGGLDGGSLTLSADPLL